MPSLKVKATLDRSDYEKGLDAMKNASKSLNTSLQGLGSVGGMIAGVFGGNAITGLFQNLISSIQAATDKELEFAKTSETLNFDTRELHDLVNVWEHFGGTIGNVTQLYGRLQGALAKFNTGDPAMTKAFKALGINSREQAAEMGNDAVFKQVLNRFGAARGAGDIGVAGQEIFGRGINNPINRRAMIAYANGERYGGKIAGVDIEAPTSEEDIALQKSAGKKKKFDKALDNVLARFWAKIVTRPEDKGGNALEMAGRAMGGVPALLANVRDFFGVDKSEIKKESDKRAAEKAETKGQDKDAIARADAEKKAHEKALSDETKRHASDLEAERRRELEEGLHIQRPETDGYQKRGILAAGGEVNTMAYQIGRQQVEIQRQLLESSRRIEARLAIDQRHKTALAEINNKFTPASAVEPEAVVE